MEFEIFDTNGVIYASDLREAGDDIRRLRDGMRRNEFVRVRRGAYCHASAWESLDASARHVLAIRAAVHNSALPVIVAGRSAAAIWRLPGAARWPDPVTLLVPRRGGGSSGAGVRRTYIGYENAEIVRIDGVPCTSLARTALDVARVSEFADAVSVVDAALSRRRPQRIERRALEIELARAREVSGTRHLSRVVGFATSLSDSPGESRARVAIHRLGYAPPQLQREFCDDAGSMFVDFSWADPDVGIEYDGKVKYTREEFTGGDPTEVLWKEKKREDRLRRLLTRFDRIITADVERPARLDRILRGAGVPRRTGSPRRTA